MDKVDQVVKSLDDTTEALSDASKDVAEDAIEAGKAGEKEAQYTLESIGKSLISIESTVKGIVNDLSVLKGTAKVPEEAEEETEKVADNAVDFVAPEIEESSDKPEKIKTGIRARRKTKRNVQ